MDTSSFRQGANKLTPRRSPITKEGIGFAKWIGEKDHSPPSLLEEKLEQLVQLVEISTSMLRRTGDVDAMRLLLDDGSEVDAKQDGAFRPCHACDGGHVEAACDCCWTKARRWTRRTRLWTHASL